MITHNVSGQLDEEDSDAAKRKRHADGDVDQIWSQLRDVLGQCVGNRLLQVVKDKTSYTHTQTHTLTLPVRTVIDIMHSLACYPNLKHQN